MFGDSFNKRIVNIRYVVDGLHFDAAVDCDWNLHCYDGYTLKKRTSMTPIELYCFDHRDWDIHMMYYKNEDFPDHVVNEQQKIENIGRGYMHNTVCNMDEIIKETRLWIKK